MRSIRSSLFPILLGILFLFFTLKDYFIGSSGRQVTNTDTSQSWRAPDINLLPHDKEGELIRYGRELIHNTSKYFGPKGIIASITNGMNCQNCHIEGGTRAFGNSFAAVAANYPMYRPRSGMIESIEFRINDCMMRSLNGNPIDTISREMQAMRDYIKWVGASVAKKEKPEGSGIVEIPFLTTAADPAKGKNIFQEKCQRCHGDNGQGEIQADSSGYVYPPLWGPHSYNVAAGLYRISRLAAFIKYNMPFGPVQLPPQLSDEEAWDVAAYIISQPREEKIFAGDWPKLETKPVDFPFGPFPDPFTAQQHKYGPFIPIVQERERAMKDKNKDAAH